MVRTDIRQFLWSRINRREMPYPFIEEIRFRPVQATLSFRIYHSDKPGIIYKTEYYTQDGKEILDNSKYDNTCLLGGKDGEPYWFSTEKDGKEGACDINGNEIVPPVFEACFYSDGEFTIKDNTGYHKWSEYNNQTNNAQASTNNKAASIKELFDLAYNTPDTEAQTKYDRYMQVIKADPYNSYGYKAPALNNLGVLYESLGDLNNAKACYEYALQACPTYDMAKQNLKSVKAQRRSKQWSTIGNILGTVGETLGTMSNSQAAEHTAHIRKMDLPTAVLLPEVLQEARCVNVATVQENVRQ